LIEDQSYTHTAMHQKRRRRKPRPTVQL